MGAVKICLLCGSPNHQLICTVCSALRRTDGKFVGNLDMVNGRPTYITRREKKHIFNKYSGLGISSNVLRDLLRAKEKLHTKDVGIVFEYGYMSKCNFIIDKVYRTTLMKFLKNGIVPSLVETHGDKQRILPFREMEWD